MALEKMEAKLAAAENAKTEPLAIVGMSCRFPGSAKTPDALWQLARRRMDAVSEMTPERWEARTNTTKGVSCRVGVIDDVDQFDAGFFGIGPAEANDMDPQHRLLLEVAWEALEDAGFASNQLQNSKTGVFIGATSRDYWDLIVPGLNEPRPYLPTGNTPANAAGRIAYILGLRGPCLALDTACSSSLVALHLACQSLRRGECDVALVGGANLILNPSIFEQLTALQILSVDGRCRTFDAQANGYVRSEGIGVVVLERLSDAQRRRDRISAIIRGSAMNHNGRATSLTAPSVQAQTAVIRAALEDARVPPERIEYVEVHSNGSPLGDPIELEALKAIIGKPRKDQSKCVLGSIKTVIGHAEAASGMASLMKAVFVLQNGVIPPNLHFQKLTPHVSIDDTPFVIPTAEISWKRGERSRIAGVSSTGLSGTNVHVVIEEPPEIKIANDNPERAAHLLVLSAKTSDALRLRAKQVLDHLAAHPNQALGDICHTLGAGRNHFDYRVAVVCASHVEASGALTAFLRDAPGSYVSERVAARNVRKRIGFFLPADALHEEALFVADDFRPPEFREAIRRGDEVVRALIGRSVCPNVRNGMYDFEQLMPLEMELFQFIVQYALVETWRVWGIEPAMILGDGTGECVAAWAAGMLELQDAIALAAARARYRDADRSDSSELAQVLSKAKHSAPRRTLVPSLGAKFNALSLTTVQYWQRQVELTMAMGNQLIQPMFSQDIGVLVRCGFPSAGPAVSQRMAAAWGQIASLRSGVAAQYSLLEGAAKLYARGHELHWDELDAPYAYRKVALPTYPFQRQKYWFVSSNARGQSQASRESKSILGELFPPRADRPESRVWQTTLEASTHRGIGFQKLVGISTLTSGGMVSLANAAIREVLGERESSLTLSCGELPLISSGNPLTMQVIVAPDGDRKATVEVFCRQATEAQWKRVAQGRATLVQMAEDDEEPGPPSMRSQRRHGIAPGRWTHRMDSLGSDPDVFLVDQIMQRQDETLARGMIAKNRACDGFINAICATTSISHPAAYGRPWTIESVEGLTAATTSSEGRAWLRIKWSQYALWSARVHAEFVSDEGEVLAKAERIDLRAQDPITLHRAAHKDPLEDATFQVIWKEAQPVAQAFATPRKWLIIANSGDLAVRLEKQLEARGDSVVTLDAKTLEQGMAQLDTLLAMAGPFWGVIHLAGLDAPSNETMWFSSLDAAFRGSTDLVFDLIERLSFRERVPRLWLVTRGAQAVEGPVSGIAQVGLWGLGRVLALERPDMWGGLIDLDPTVNPEEPLLLAQVFTASNAEDLNALRGSKRYVARLARVSLLAQDSPNVRPDRTYVLSRALSPLGLEIAQWLVTQGARSLLLIDKPDVFAACVEQRKYMQALQEQGVTISFVGGDTTDADTVQAIMFLAFDRVGGVIHIDDGEGRQLHNIATRGAKAAFEETLRSSCLVPWTLHKLTADLELDFFILFSPLYAALGWEGRGADAMAAEYMDAIARMRTDAGGRALSLHIAFPIEAKLPDTDLAHEMLVAGIQGMPPTIVMPAIEQLLANDVFNASVGWIDWESFEQAHRIRAARPLFEGVVAVRSGLSGPGQLRRRIATAEPQKAKRMIEEVIRKEFARLLGQNMTDLPSTDDAFLAFGMDSIMVLQALTSIGAALGISLPVRVLLNQPTLDGLAENIASMLHSGDDREEGIVVSARSGRSSNLLIELKSTGTKQPFFCVPGLMGAGLVFQALAQRLDPDRKVYAFNAPGLEIDTMPCDKIEIVASRYVEVMRQVLPHGPYLIGGYSLGSFIAFEMAKMLQSSGERVDLCILMDPPAAPGAAEESRIVAMSRLFRIPIEPSVIGKLNIDEQITMFAKWVSETLGLPSDVGESTQQLRLYRAHLHALLDYAPVMYNGPLHMLIARDSAATASQSGLFSNDATFGWGALCTGGVNTREIPGDHFSALFEPHVDGFASVLRALLDQLESR